MIILQTLRLRRGLAWLVLAILSLGALAPSATRWHAADQGALAGIEVCTTQGMRWVQMPAGESQPVSPSTSSPCIYCLLVADRLGPPPATSVHFFKAESGLAPPDEQAFSFVKTTTIAARPRGPPYVA
ncbi:MAG: DUF2946 family protein [Curvibacter sp.]|nr:DUF2946 family protein [Curvibacter sp.]